MCFVSYIEVYYALHTANFSNNRMRSIIKFGFYMSYNYTKFNSLPFISIFFSEMNIQTVRARAIL